MIPALALWLVLLLWIITLVHGADTISHPQLDFDKLGGKLNLLGSFNSISYYTYENASSSLSLESNTSSSSSSSSTPSNNKLFIRDLKNDTTKNFANVNGQISNVQSLSDSTILVNGDFSKFNDQDCQTPIIYNITSKTITNIFSPSTNKRDDLPSLNGQVKTTFVDNDLIYIGGEFSYNDSYGALVYNQTSKTLSQLPFKGFGEHAIVNAITKLTSSDDENDELGSIIFGGKFDTLGLPDLLLHNLSLIDNTTNHTNSTNSSLITAEQKITLKYGDFSDVNGDGSNPSSLICPENNPLWAPKDNSGGQWLVELPTQMKGITPTKVRLYPPDGSDSVNLFRIYSYPNNGIMNLSYIDPDTNEIRYCDAWCPLATIDQLTDATDSNLDNIDDLNQDDVYVDEEDGTYSTYYDPDTKTKTLAYASGFQEFSFEDQIGIDKIGLTVVSWHGSKGALAGFELYLNIINVYGNQTLNEPNCGEDPNKSNLVQIESGDFKSIQSMDSSLINSNYQVSIGDEGKIIMYPNITYSGDYSIIMITPGCIADNSCNSRSIVNVTIFDTDENVLERKTIYQNNDYEKFDYLYYGHLDGSTLSDGQNRIEIEYVNPVIPDTNDPWMVIDRIQANIVELDNYRDINSTNRTNHDNSTDYGLVELKLSGLFEYSLSNFSYFEESLLYVNGDKHQISPNNSFVGNSTINVLSSQLSNDSTVNQFNKGEDSLLMLGDFQSNSDNLTLSNNNIINLKIGDYNTTSNSSVVDIMKRQDDFDVLEMVDDFEGLDLFDLIDPETIILNKRDDDIIFGATFNNSITTIESYYDTNVLLGRFSMNNQDNDSIKIYDLSSDNNTVNIANNFVIKANDDEFYSFGNDYIDEAFDSFTNITVKSTEYFIFGSSGSDQDTSKTWDNTHRKWINDPNRQLNISQAINLPNNQQIISGSSFNIMDNYITDQAYIESNKNIQNQKFNSYNLSLDGESSIKKSYYINESISVIGGEFMTDEGDGNVGFIDTKNNNSFIGLNGDMDISNITIQTLYVDSNSEYLVIGYNGSISIDDSKLSGGIIIYDLVNNSFTDFQPAELINSGDSSLEVNAIGLLNDDNKLLVGGKFDSAGSLNCENLCIYDIKNTRWESPDSSLKGDKVTTINFFKSNQVLLTGSFSDNKDFIIYNIDDDKFKSIDSLNDGLSNDHDESIQKLLMCDNKYDDKLNGRFIAIGNNFIKGFDGDKWHDISGINFSNSSYLTDLKLLTLKDSNYKGHNDHEKYFNKDNILVVSGAFELEDFGVVNLALFDGTDWIPFVYSASSLDQLGLINSILVKDQFRFLSQEDIKNKASNLSSGQVVGISLACALGSTILLSLLYIIPYFIFFRKNKEEQSSERIGEKEMTDAVNPQELLHEIDLQRNH